MRSIPPTTVRFDDEDKRLIEIVKKKYGQSSLIGALRTALRIASDGTNVALERGEANEANGDTASESDKSG